MPPHVIPHILRAGGIPALIGLVVGLVLGWPREDVGSVEIGGVRVPSVSYHNELGGSGLSQAGAFGAMIGWAILFAVIGLGIGYLLIALGIISKDDAGISD